MRLWQREKHLVALEVGTSKIALAAGVVNGDGQLSLIGACESRSAGIRKGEVVKPDNALVALRDAVELAESTFGITVDEVHLALSGSHLLCEERQTMLSITRPSGQITEEDVMESLRMAQDFTVGPTRLRVAELPRAYRIDGGECIANPVGMFGHKLECHYLLVHGIHSRMENLIQLVRELSLSIPDFALSPVVAADAILTQDQKDRGVLVVDMGGGLTHYSLHFNGKLEKMGVIGIGGDHVTQDIARAFNLPLKQSDELKCHSGAVHLEKIKSSEVLTLPPAAGFAGKRVFTESLVRVMRCRVEETLEIVRDDIGERIKSLGAGVILTGGGARTRGIETLASEVFGQPAACVELHHLSGPKEDLARPELSPVLGMLIAAHRKLGRRKSPLPNLFKSTMAKMGLF